MTIKMAHNYQNLFIYRRSNTRTNQTKMWLEVDFFFIFFKIFLHGFSNFWKHLLSKCWHLIGRNEHQMQPFQVLFIFFAGVMNSKNAFLFCLTPSGKGLMSRHQEKKKTRFSSRKKIFLVGKIWKFSWWGAKLILNRQ